MYIHNQILNEIFKCEKCLNVMIDPITTKCGHNFCLKCLCFNKSDFLCHICKVYLTQNDFYSNKESKKTIKYLSQSSKSKYEISCYYFNLKEYGNYKKSHLSNDDNYEMNFNFKEKIGVKNSKTTEKIFNSFNLNLNHGTNLNDINTNFTNMPKPPIYRIKRKNNEMNKCLKPECIHENVENKLEEYLKAFSKSENEFKNNLDYKYQNNPNYFNQHQLEYSQENIFSNFEPIPKKFKR